MPIFPVSNPRFYCRRCLKVWALFVVFYFQHPKMCLSKLMSTHKLPRELINFSFLCIVFRTPKSFCWMKLLGMCLHYFYLPSDLPKKTTSSALCSLENDVKNVSKCSFLTYTAFTPKIKLSFNWCNLFLNSIIAYKSRIITVIMASHSSDSSFDQSFLYTSLTSLSQKRMSYHFS